MWQVLCTLRKGSCASARAISRRVLVVSGEMQAATKECGR